MQHQAQLDRAKELGEGRGYDYSDCFTLIAPTVTKADYAVCNLEVPLGGGPDYTGYPCFSAPDSYAEALRDAGFDMMLTANNHCLDRRDKAARRTPKALDRIGLDHIGTYHDRADRDTLVPFIKDINGFKIGFLNYTYGTNGIAPREGMEVALIDRDKMKQEISPTRRCRSRDSGGQYALGYRIRAFGKRGAEKPCRFSRCPGRRPYNRRPSACRAADEGGAQRKRGKDVLVVYSLGNLISNMKTADTRGGAHSSGRQSCATKTES